MRLVNWDDQYRTGVTLFDDEHKYLVVLINELHSAMIEGRTQPVAQETLRKLLEYTEVHFAHEESAFASTGYPAAAAHIIQHNKLRRRVVAFVSSGREPDVEAAKELLVFLRDWLLGHICTSDKAYGSYLNSRGIR